MSKYLSDDEIFGTGSYLSDEEMFGQKDEKPKKTSLLEDITDVGSAVVEGAKKTFGSARAAVNTITDDRSGVIERAREARELELGSEVDALKALKADLQARKKTGDDTIVQGIRNVAGAVAANPTGGVQLIAEQAPNAALSLGAGFAGAKAGAVGGALVGGPVGAAVGGVGGFLAGLFGANTLLETGSKAIEKAGQGTFTPEDRSAALREGATKGAVITGVDAVTLGASKFVLGAAGRAVEQATVRTLQDAGIDAARAARSIREAQQAAVQSTKGAGQKATVEAVEKATIEAMAREGLLDPALRASVTSAQKTAFETTNTLVRRTGRGASAVGLQSVGEGLGEGLGEFVATGEFSPTEAVLEGVAGLSQSLPELYVANRLNEPGILTQAMSQQRADAPPPAAPGTPAAQRELAATLPELEAAVTAYVQPSDVAKARTVDEAVSLAEQAANVPLTTPAPAPVTGIPALRQMADRNAELVGQANQAGTGFDQRMALEQAQAALPPAAPRTAEQFVDLKPMEPMEARQRLAVLRDQLAEPLTLQIVSHPSEAGKLAIARAQMPLQAADLELNTAAPAPSPAAAQSRIESAALAGQEQQRRAEDAPRQDMIGRTMAAIEARGGVASPYEAELLRAANMGQPFNRIDPSLGRPATADEQLTAATGVAVGQEAGLGFGARESTRQQPAAPAFEYTPDLQGRKAEQPAAAPEVSIEQTFVQQMRETNTPAARAFVQDYEAGRISDADVTQALEAQRALPASSQERIETAAAQATPEAAPTGVQVEELRSRGVSPVLAEAVSLYGNRPLTEQDLTVEGATARVERAAAQAPAAQAEGIQVETGLEPRSAFLGRNEAIRTGNNLPRPARVGGVPASSLTDEQLRTTAGNENLPAVTRRSAQIELLAREQEQRGAAPAAVEGDVQSRLEAAANEGRLAQPSGGMIITTGAKFSSKRDPVPGATFTVNDGNDAQGQPVKHEVTVVDASRMGNTGRLLKQVARIFGKRLVVFESPTLRADGFVQAGDNQSIYVNTSTEASPLAVFFHELTHLLKRENPEAYAALEAVVKRNLRDGAEDYREGADLEEITSDLVGNRVLMDPDFLGQVFEEIAAQNPEGARGIIVRLAAAINKSIRAFKQAVTQGGFTDTEALVKDLNAIQAAVKQALVTYAQQQREPAARLQMEVAKTEQAAPAAAIAPGATPAAAPAAASARAPVSEVEREFGLDKLRLSAQRQTETPEFKEFYKDSQVRTATGKPVMLYRGMRGESLPAEGVESFTTEPGLYGTGIYMSSSARRSEGYTKGEKGQMYPVFASVKNPIDADDFVERFGRAKRTPEESQRITDQLIAEGYDGVVERGGPGGFIEVMAFRPEQVKSVFNERPTSDPRITKSAQRDWQKADAADVKKAEVYEERTGMAPYTSEGQISVPLDGEGTKFSVKRAYGEKEFAKGRANDPLTGLPLNKNGTVTLYFPTSNAVARELARTKKLTGATPNANRIYLTNESSGPKVMNEPGNIDHQMDGANVLLQVDPRLLHLDREYPDGRKDFFIPVAEGQAYKSKMTKLFTLDAPRTRALSKETKLTDLQQRIGDALNQYLQLDGAARKARLEQARQVLKDEHNVGTLLGVNGKLEKTNTGGYGLNNYNGKDVMSMGLGLASAQKINEKNLSTCPNSAICEGLCLGETSGQNLLYGGEGQFKSGPRLAQYLKTEALVQHPEDFAIVLHNEIEKFQRAAAKEDYQPTVRLNVTSDFRPQTFEGIIDAFPGVMFYDYTKLPSNSIAPNHHLTYSSTGASQIVNGKVVVNKESNWDKMVDDRLTKGMNVAMAFTSRTAMPKFILDERTGQRFQVWDGDNYDARFLDPKPGQPGNELNQGMIVGLTNKDKTTKPEDAAVKHNGFFLDYDPDRDGDTLVIKNQKALAGGGKKTIPIAAKPANDGAAQISASRQRNAELSAQADAIAAMDADTRDNMELGDFPGGGDAYNLYEARKLLKKPSDKLKRVTENNSFNLWTEYEFIGNVDGELIGVNKEEDPDEPDDDTKFVYAYQRLENPLGPRVTTTTDQVDELFNEVRAGGATLSRQRDTGWRDETGRAQFAPGAVAYRYAADVANAVLDKVGLKPISTELGRAMRKMKVEVEKAQNLTVDVAEKLKTLSEDERQMISDVIEGELKAGVTPPKKILDLAASMQTIMSEQSAELVRLGMLSPEAAGRWEGKYLPRFYETKLTGEVKGWARAALELVRKPRTMQGIKGSNLKSRGIFKTIPVDELDQWTAEGWEQRDPGFNPAKDRETQVWRDFTREEREEMGEIRDAMFRFVMGYNATQRDVALGRMYERIAQDVASRTEKEGFVQVPDTKVTDTQARRYGALAGMYVPKEVMDHLSAYDGTMQNEIVKMYLSALAKWKEGKTVLNPVSHANNILSNLTMAHFAGVSYWDAGKYAGAVRDLMRNDPMVKEAQEAGLFLGTFSRADLLKDMPDQLKMLAGASEGKIAKAGNTVWNALSFFLNKPLGKAYDAEDQFFRYLIYRDARKRGLESDDAVEYAQRFIFTYDDLPKTARIIRDTALPFFSYTYKVVPALASTALEKPWRFAAPAGILYGVNALFYAMAQAAGEGEDDDWLEAARRYITDPAFRARAKGLEESERANLPEWMKGMSATLGTPKAIRLGMDDVTNLPLFLDVSKIFPGGDLLDAVNNSGGVAMLQPLTPSSPLLTTFVAMMANRDMFLGKDVTKGSDTQAELAEKRGEWLWRQFSPALAVGNYHWDRTLNAIASIAGEPVLGYTGFGKDGLPVQPGLAALQTVGIKVRPIDLEMSERIEQSDRKRLIRELDAEIRRLNQLEARGAITPDNAEAQRELQREKRIRLREGLTVDGEER